MKQKSKLVCIILLVVMICSMFVMPNNVYAYGINDSNDRDRVAYKLWSIGKVAGMTDEQCAGMIGNAAHESGLDPESVECFNSIAYEFNGVSITEGKYITDFCDYTLRVVFPTWENDGGNLPEYTDKHGHTWTPTKSNSGNPFSMSTYCATDDGHFAPGIGLFQWTGSRFSKLRNFANSKRMNWFDEDLQMLFTFNLVDNSIQDMASWIANIYIPNYQEASVDQCTEVWRSEFEGGSTGMDACKAYAQEFYDKFKGTNGDVEYGKEILKKCNFPVRLANATREIVDRSIIHEFASPVIVFARSAGFQFDVDGSADEYAYTASAELLKSMKEYVESEDKLVTTAGNDVLSKKYSLYDLFGSDIHWYRYLGESTQYVKLLDHVWSAYDQDKMDLLSLGDTVFYESNDYLSTTLYKFRPKVLTVQDTVEGKSDPRVKVITNERLNGYNFVVGNVLMFFAKWIVGLVGYLMGPQPIKDLRKVADLVFSIDIWPKVLLPLVFSLIAISMVFFILSFVGKVKNYTVGRAGRKEVIKRFVVGVLCLGITLAFAYNPSSFVNISEKIATFADTVFNAALTDGFYEDDVVGSTDGTKTVEAMLWKTAIFEPWCIGQFGDRYEHLYTQYATDLKSGQSKMEQSNFLLQTHADGSPYKNSDIQPGTIEYSSASYTGDVLVPVGNNVYIRNWAAYLYSCQSKYHIDQNFIDGYEDVPETDPIVFPNMYTTAYDGNVAADTFRVIDAQMNISPQLYTDKVINSYADAHMIKNNFHSQGRNMLIYAFILLVAFLPAIIQKLYHLARMFIFTVQVILSGIMELAKEGAGLKQTPSQFFEHVVQYFLAALRLFVLVQLYYVLVGQSMLQTILFCILTLGVYSITYNWLRNTIRSVPTRIRYIKTRIDNSRGISI